VSRNSKDLFAWKLMVAGLPFIACLLLMTPTHGEVAVDRLEAWPGIFGGHTTELQFRISSPKPFRTRVAWSLSAYHRTIQQGESVADGQSVVIRIRLDRVPAVRSVVEGQLRLAVLHQDGTALARRTDSVWLFPDNPFADWKQRLKRLDIAVFDPLGNTRRRLAEMEIPCRQLADMNAVSELSGGLLVIGEGVLLSDHPGIVDTIFDRSSQGVSTICLAPSGGRFRLPIDRGEPNSAPSSMVFGGPNEIADLDRDLGSSCWVPTDNEASRCFAVTAARSHISAKVTESHNGWMWVDIGYRTNNAHVIFCGYPIICNWDSSPSARYLLAGILRKLDKRDQPESSEEQ
jgi:hypothetical protein